MAELERELRGLAAAIDFPETPDIAAAVRAHLREAPTPQRRSSRRTIAIVAASIAAFAVAAGAAVPGARTAVLHLFGVGEVRVELVDRLPEVGPDMPLDLGEPIDPSEAPFVVARPSLLGEPDLVYRRGDRIVSLLYGKPDRVRTLLTEIVSSGFTPDIGKKLAAAGTYTAFVPIRGSVGPGLWISGEPHTVQLPGGRPRLAENTLIWVHGRLTLRLEGALTLRQAVAIAESVK